jgi:hypothetical protein
MVSGLLLWDSDILVDIEQKTAVVCGFLPVSLNFFRNFYLVPAILASQPLLVF